MKKKLLKAFVCLLLIAVGVSGRTLFDKFNANISINSNNPNITNVQATYAILNNRGQIVMQGLGIDPITGDTVTWTSQSYVIIDKQ